MKSDSATTTSRPYRSPLRDQRAQATREAILAALHDLMISADAPDDISMEAIAARAGVQRRTVFRHFETKDALLAAFWRWLNARIGAATEPASAAEIVGGPRAAFPLLDRHEAAIRAALHSRTGRAMRLATIPGRRQRFAEALRPALAGLPPAEAARVEALAHLLYSASAWEVLKDYGGLDGAEAGETASWALGVILSAAAPRGAHADIASPATENSDEP